MSKESADRMRGPTTRAGRLVWQFLMGQDTRYALRLMWHPTSTPELVAQAWIIGMRRTFAREVDPQAARDYISGALRRQGEGSIRPGVVAALVKMALHGSPPHLVPRAERALVLPVLLDLVRTNFASERDSAELVRAAERRLLRLRRKTRRSGWRSRIHRRVPQSEGDTTPADTRPNSVIGHILKAQASHDRERLRTLPSEKSDTAAVALVDAAFGAVVEERFRRGRTAEMVAGLAGRVVTASSEPLLDEAIVTSVIEGSFDGVADGGVTPDLALRAKVAVFVQAVEDLGLYDREVDDILCHAEQVTEAGGISLTPMGWIGA